MSMTWWIVCSALCDYWSEVKGFWSAGKSSMYREKVRNVFSEVKWSEVKWFWRTGEIEYVLEQGLESDKWRELKWSEVKIS